MNDSDMPSRPDEQRWVSPPLTKGGLWLAVAGALTAVAFGVLAVVALLNAPHTFLAPIGLGVLTGVVLLAAGVRCRKVLRDP